MTTGELSYMRAVEIADRMLADGMPVVGVAGSADGRTVSIWLDRGPKAPSLRLEQPADTNIMSFMALARERLAGEAVAP